MTRVLVRLARISNKQRSTIIAFKSYSMQIVTNNKVCNFIMTKDTT